MSTLNVQLAVGFVHVVRVNTAGNVQFARRSAFKATLLLLETLERVQVPLFAVPFHAQLMPLGLLLVMLPGLDPEKARLTVTPASEKVFCVFRPLALPTAVNVNFM